MTPAPAPVLPASLRRVLLSPALVVDLERVRHNVGRVIRALGDDPGRWRPHVKTVKVAPVAVELLRAGVRAFKCATTREAACLLEVLEREGLAGDVLLAHPLAGPNLERLAEIAAAHRSCRVSVLSEDPMGCGSIPEALGVFVDVNPGMNRTGLALERRDDIVSAARGAGERFRGIHFYEGHLHDLDPETRRRRAFACYDGLVTLVGALRAAGVEVPEVVTSGTPTFRCALEHGRLSRLDGVTHRVSPGTVLYHDLRSERENPDLGLLPAALLFCRVVSRPAPDVATTDAGSKSLAAESGDPCAEALGWPGLVALPPSEEHLPFRATDGRVPPRGTELLLVPRHVCPTVNLAEQAVLLDAGRFAGVADVEARAHEVLSGWHGSA